MKYLLALVLLGALAFSSQAQSINGIPVAELDMEYIQVIARPYSVKGEYFIIVNLGQKEPLKLTKEKRFGTLFIDEKGEKFDVINTVEALNLMYEYGYEVFSTYYCQTGGMEGEYFMLRKIKKKD